MTVSMSLEGKNIVVTGAAQGIGRALSEMVIELGGNVVAVDMNEAALNELADENLEVVSSPYLSNVKYPGYSENAWFLFGSPAQIDTFEIGYLKGRRTPTVERGDSDFNTLALWFRVYFDLGVREQDHRGMVRSAGQ